MANGSTLHLSIGTISRGRLVFAVCWQGPQENRLDALIHSLALRARVFGTESLSAEEAVDSGCVEGGFVVFDALGNGCGSRPPDGDHVEPAGVTQQPLSF